MQRSYPTEAQVARLATNAESANGGQAPNQKSMKICAATFLDSCFHHISTNLNHGVTESTEVMLVTPLCPPPAVRGSPDPAHQSDRRSPLPQHETERQETFGQ